MLYYKIQGSVAYLSNTNRSGYSPYVESETTDGGYLTGSIEGNQSINQISLDGEVVLPESCINMFAYMPIQSIDLEHLNSSNVKVMEQMFYYSGIKTFNAKNTLFSINRLQIMRSMFAFSDLEETDILTLRHDNTLTRLSNLTRVFEGCSKLKNIEFGREFNTEYVQSFTSMFKNCEALEGCVDMSYISMARCIDINSMFQGCINLESVKFSKLEFHTGIIRSIGHVFTDCVKLTDVDFGELWAYDAEEFINAYEMFKNCESIEVIDLSNIKLGIFYSTSSMFENCVNLKTIYTAYNWQPYGDDRNIFKNCYSIVGGSGTTYDPSKTGFDMCNYTNGYFTYKKFKEEAFYYADADYSIEGGYAIRGKN